MIDGVRDSRSVALPTHHGGVLKTRSTLFDGPPGEDHTDVWIEADGAGAVIRSHSWGPDVERHFGSDAIETWLILDARALETVAHALVMDWPAIDPTTPPIDTLAEAYRGSAAISHARRRLDELGVRTACRPPEMGPPGSAATATRHGTSRLLTSEDLAPLNR